MKRQSVMGSALALALILSGCARAPYQQAVSQSAPSEPAPPVRAVEAAPPAPLPDKNAKAVADPASTVREMPPGPPIERSMPSALRGVSVPVWRVGDQWAFRWESAQGQGEYVWTVDRIEVLDGVEHYVVKTGPREIFYRVRDLATSLETNAGSVQARHVPPRLSFSWPLTPGTIWRQSVTQQTESDSAERTIAWQVEGEERIRVDAGTFDTLKIVAWHEFYKSGAVMYEMWYAPKVKQWVRLQEHFPAGIRYRELTEYALN